MTDPTNPEQDPGPAVRIVRTIVITVGGMVAVATTAAATLPEDWQGPFLAGVGVIAAIVVLATAGLNAWEAHTGRRITGRPG